MSLLKNLLEQGRHVRLDKFELLDIKTAVDEDVLKHHLEQHHKWLVFNGVLYSKLITLVNNEFDVSVDFERVFFSPKLRTVFFETRHMKGAYTYCFRVYAETRYEHVHVRGVTREELERASDDPDILDLTKF